MTKNMASKKSPQEQNSLAYLKHYIIVASPTLRTNKLVFL
jgi:hypothetical protein